LPKEGTLDKNKERQNKPPFLSLHIFITPKPSSKYPAPKLNKGGGQTALIDKWFSNMKWRLLKKDRLIPLLCIHKTEPLNIFNYWFKVGKRSLIECVIF